MFRVHVLNGRVDRDLEQKCNDSELDSKQSSCLLDFFENVLSLASRIKWSEKWFALTRTLAQGSHLSRCTREFETLKFYF